MTILCLAALIASLASSSSTLKQPRAERLRQLVTELAIPTRNWLDTASLNRTASFVRQQIESSGFACSEQLFAVDKRTYRNIECTIPGKSKDLVVVGAHYDAAGERPGADDNASGVAGLIDLARAYSETGHKPRSSIRLVAFTLEEPPFYATEDMGSFHHARKLKDSGFTVKAMISLEMIGYLGDSLEQRYPPGIPSDRYPRFGNFYAAVSNMESAGLTKEFKALADKSKTIPVVTLNAPEGVEWSDHMNYWKFGYPAFMLTDTAFLRNFAYHTAADTPDHLNYPAMARLVDILFDFTRKL